MYYEETIINGILCWRDEPNGKWCPCSAQKITKRLAETRSQRDAVYSAWNAFYLFMLNKHPEIEKDGFSCPYLQAIKKAVDA